MKGQLSKRSWSLRFRQLAVGVMIALVGIIGCQRPQEAGVPTSASEVGGDPEINEVLGELFGRHGVDTQADGAWLLADNGIRVAGAVVRELPSPEGTANVQLDFYLDLPDGRLLIESAGGVGKNRSEAVQDGLNNFILGSLHVLLSAFFAAPANAQVTVEQWTVNGLERTVIIGGMTIRSFGGEPFEPPHDWFHPVQKTIEQSELPAGTHWLRCYYAQLDGESLEHEGLLDNDVWSPVVQTLVDYNWPASSNFYSVRLFVVILDADDDGAEHQAEGDTMSAGQAPGLQD